MKFGPLAILFFFIASTGLAKSPYKYNLDPQNAEQILAQLASRPRLMDEEWLNIVGEHRDDTYTIVAGDSLWSISSRVLNNPFLWRKLWQENPGLGNPHELVVGETLSYYRVATIAAQARGIASVDEPKSIPVIKLTQASIAAGMDLDNDSFINRDIKNRSVPRIMVLPPDDDLAIGEITGAYSNGDGINPLAVLFMAGYEGADIKEGAKFSVIHKEHEVKDTSRDGSPVLGDLYTLEGDIEIVEKGEQLWKIRIAHMFGTVSRGDLVIPFQEPTRWTTSVEPPNKLQARILAGEDPDYRLFGQNQLVLLSKGENDGMKEGFLFRIWHDTDPSTEKKDGVEPISKGDVRVIFVGATASVGLILKNREPIEVGDTVVPCQVFTNPQLPPQRDFSSFEID